MRHRAAFLTVSVLPLLGLGATTFNPPSVAFESISAVGLFVTPSNQDDQPLEGHGPWARDDVLAIDFQQEALETIARLAGTLDGVQDQMILAKGETLFLYLFQNGPCDARADEARRERLKAMAKLEDIEVSAFPRDCFRLAVKAKAHR